eukprot:GHVP01005889.1.p1 GENE.GHVP01005889.1~~GHVP01005889.1.p1  ORF type:complete len:238 (+),score=20.41 GHVP01005889.1:28-714(+)
MADYIAQGAANQIFGDVQKEWSNFTGGIRGSTSSAPQTQIDWLDFNYPPLLRIMHYNLEELPTSLSPLVRRMNFLFTLTSLILVVSFIQGLIIGIGIGDWFKPCFALFDFIIIMPVAGWTFYTGYKGLAISDNSKIFKYTVAQSLLGGFYVLFAIIYNGGFNGFLSFLKMSDFPNAASGMITYWSIVVVVESLVWIGLAILAFHSAYSAKNFNPFHSAEAQPSARSIS